MKSGTHRRTNKRQTLSILTAAAALFTTAQFAEAKVDARLKTAVTSASTTDIEAITQSIGVNFADQMAVGGRGAIKLNPPNVNFLVKGLADAIVAKTSVNPPDPSDVNRLDNKIDELGELASFVFHSLVGRAVNTKAPGAKKYALAVMKNTLKTAITTTDFLTTDVVTDVVGSVALTIHNDIRISDKNETKIAKALKKVAKTIAGKPNKDTVVAALAAGFAGGTGFEDGNLPDLTAVADPETDFRNS